MDITLSLKYRSRRCFMLLLMAMLTQTSPPLPPAPNQVCLPGAKSISLAIQVGQVADMHSQHVYTGSLTNAIHRRHVQSAVRC